MPGDGFRVSPDALAAHAGRVQQIGDAVNTAKGAGNAVQMDLGAYGQVCTIVPIIIGVLQGILIAGIDDAVQSLRHTSEQLKATADDYRRTDEAIQRDMDNHSTSVRGPS